MKKRILIFLIIILIVVIVFSILVEKNRTKDKVQIKENLSVTDEIENIIYTNAQEDVKENTNEINVQNNILEEIDKLNQTDTNIYENNETKDVLTTAEIEKSNVENKQEQENLSKEIEQQPQQNNSVQTEMLVENSPILSEEIKIEEPKFCVDGGNIHILGDGENEHRILRYLG